MRARTRLLPCVLMRESARKHVRVRVCASLCVNMCVCECWSLPASDKLGDIGRCVSVVSAGVSVNAGDG